MVTKQSEKSIPHSCDWHCKAPCQGNWKQTPQTSRSHGENDLALRLKCFRLLLSDLWLPSINIMTWQRARLIKLNYFWSCLRLTVLQHWPRRSSFTTGQSSVSGFWMAKWIFCKGRQMTHVILIINERIQLFSSRIQLYGINYFHFTLRNVGNAFPRSEWRFQWSFGEKI